MISWGVIDNWGWIWSVIYIWYGVIWKEGGSIQSGLWTKYLFISLGQFTISGDNLLVALMKMLLNKHGTATYLSIIL